MALALVLAVVLAAAVLAVVRLVRCCLDLAAAHDLHTRFVAAAAVLVPAAAALLTKRSVSCHGTL